MKSTPITQRAATKYGSAPKNEEVTVDAGGKSPANFARMSPIKNASLVQGAGDVGRSKNKSVEFDTSVFEDKKKESSSKEEKEEKDSGVDLGTAVQVASAVLMRSPAKNTGKKASWSKTEEGAETSTTQKGDTVTNYSGGGTFKNKEEKDWYNKQIKQRIDSGMSQEEAVQDYRNTFKIGEKKTTTGPDKTITSKEPDETYSGDLYRAQYGKARSSYGSRQDKRQTLSETRKEKRNKINTLRAQMKAGEITREQFKDAKKQAKLDMYKQRSKEFETQKKNREYAQQQGAAAGDKVRLDDVAKTFGDYESDDQQMAMGLAQQKAERTRNQAAAENASNFFKNALARSSSEPAGFDYSPSLIKPALTQTNNLMYDLNNLGIGNTTVKNPDIESGIMKRGYKMGGFGSKNKNK